MAEWTIAAVLKTAGLTAPGVRIPLPPLACQLVVGVGIAMRAYKGQGSTAFFILLAFSNFQSRKH